MNTSKELRLAIVVPSMQTWHADFGMALTMMACYLSHQVPGYTSQVFTIHNTKGSILAQLRERAVALAIKNHATHLLFVDSDQTFPKDTAHRLLAHGKPVVACNVATRMLPSGPTARLSDGVPLYTRKGSGGLVKVWRVGTGVMLIDIEAIKHLEQPLFAQHWNPEKQDYTGEDWAFCEKLEAAGIPIFVDQHLSREIGHVGQLVYSHDLVEMAKSEVA